MKYDYGIDYLIKITQLEKIASEIKKKLIFSRRPLVIEFCGTPKAGKTYAVQGLELFLKRNEFENVEILTERASVCPIQNKKSFIFNVWTACSALAGMVAAIQKNVDILIMDRALFDALCWLEYFQIEGKIYKEEKQIFEDFIKLKTWVSMIDITFVLKVEPQVALEREFKDKFTRKKGSIMNEVTLNNFNRGIDNAVSNHSKAFKNVKVIDTTKLEAMDAGYVIVNESLKALESLVEEKLLVIPNNYINSIGVSIGLNTNINIKNQLLEYIKNNNKYLSRYDAEEDRNNIQIIPIAIIKYENKVLLLRKKETDPAKRFHDKYMIWAGGHLREEDNIDTEDPFMKCLERELKEELDIRAQFSKQYLGILYDTTNPKSKIHLGIAYVCEVSTPDVALSISQTEFRERKGKSLSGTFQEPSELIKENINLENWSLYILENYFNVKIPSKPIQKSLFD